MRRISTLNPLAVARWLFVINALIWFALGITSLGRISSSNPESTVTLWVVVILMFGNALAMLISGIGITTQHKLFYFFALAILAVNIILTFTDQFGMFDFITLVVDLVILALLIASWCSFFQERNNI